MRVDPDGRDDLVVDMSNDGPGSFKYAVATCSVFKSVSPHPVHGYSQAAVGAGVRMAFKDTYDSYGPTQTAIIVVHTLTRRGGPAVSPGPHGTKPTPMFDPTLEDPLPFEHCTETLVLNVCGYALRDWEMKARAWANYMPGTKVVVGFKGAAEIGADGGMPVHESSNTRDPVVWIRSLPSHTPIFDSMPWHPLPH